MQNSLQRLFAGMAAALADDVLPEVADEFARAQLAACIELLGNLATRVEWRRDQLEAVAAGAEQAVADAVSVSPRLADALPAPLSDDADLVARRDDALARVSAAMRWCDDHDAEAARIRLVEFAVHHLELELALLRTGKSRS